ncbi:hypothetical protein FVR03_18520 [Pontibacter qinzhouensis]|uniref:DUF4890 domain-containing protein n=1 Tax=Pontibacter qinzhouensis TaxID=2603253 RepID=A0A5C8J7A6_9BACT|nr:hypothetical protein [Pontibacter qinzhouensis]TXK33835.1 hypothetical protein FVR03_18520 [Pontibacter qinzhouensis]
MKKNALLLFFCLGLLFCATGVQAQGPQNSTGKDEFWGTPKAATRGATADAVGAREADLDKRHNTYETGKRKNFKIMRYNDKKLQEYEKKEKQMLKQYKRQKKQLARRRD